MESPARPLGLASASAWIGPRERAPLCRPLPSAHFTLLFLSLSLCLSPRIAPFILLGSPLFPLPPPPLPWFVPVVFHRAARPAHPRALRPSPGRAPPHPRQHAGILLPGDFRPLFPPHSRQGCPSLRAAAPFPLSPPPPFLLALAPNSSPPHTHALHPHPPQINPLPPLRKTHETNTQNTKTHLRNNKRTPTPRSAPRPPAACPGWRRSPGH